MSDLLARYSSVSVQLSTISVRVGQTVESLITSLLQRVHPISTVFQYLSDRLGLKATVARNRTVELAPVMPQTGITLPLASNGTVIQYLDKGCVTVNPIKFHSKW